MLAFAFASFTPILMASAAEEGFVTAMNYAMKMSAVPEALLGGQIALIVGIKLSELSARRDSVGFGRAYERVSQFMIWLCVPLAFVLSLAAPGLLRILMLRGAYSEVALRVTARLFQGLVLGFPMTVSHALVYQALAAQQKVLLRNVFNIIQNAVLVAALWWGVPRIGIINYPFIKVSYVYLLYLISLPVWRYWFSGVRIGRVFGFLVGSMVVNGLLAAGIWWLMASWSYGETMLGTLLLASGFIILAGLLMVLCPWNRVPAAYAKELWRSGMRSFYRQRTHEEVSHAID